MGFEWTIYKNRAFLRGNFWVFLFWERWFEYMEEYVGSLMIGYCEHLGGW
jgi:hypothetical protein